MLAALERFRTPTVGFSPRKKRSSLYRGKEFANWSKGGSGRNRMGQEDNWFRTRTHRIAAICCNDEVYINKCKIAFCGRDVNYEYKYYLSSTALESVDVIKDLGVGKFCCSLQTEHTPCWV